MRTFIQMAFAAALLVSAAGAAKAEGAFAVGSTGDVASDGFAYGWAVNISSRRDARERSVEHCKSYKDAPRAAAKCKVMTSFVNQCVAVAMDPKAGTPGLGWAIADTRKDAESQAMIDCRETAGRSRREFCKPHAWRCDGDAD